MPKGIHLCRFDSASHLSNLTYEKAKQAVLEAGRYSVFEATASYAKAKIFEALNHDPELVCTRVGFPWIKVERRVSPQKETLPALAESVSSASNREGPEERE